MSKSETDVGHRPQLNKRFGKTLMCAAAATIVAAAIWSSVPVTIAGGESRTISLFHIHTKESLTVTYMKDGRYVPSAMKKINYLLRDWRRDAVVTIDPKTLDLVWELHEDLGSHKPVHVVSGYRSPRTNAFLKRIGRNVAKHSQHMSGKAIDFYFPDVPTQKIRNSALVREVGGVGYYRTSGGPTGFLHVDSGRVRHWGPAISRSQWASIMREGSKTVGRRLSKGGSFAVASASDAPAEGKRKSGGLFSWLTGSGKKAAESPQIAAANPEINTVYAGSEDDMAELAADAAVAPAKAKIKADLKQAAPQIADDFGDEDIASLTATIAGEETAVRPPEVKVGDPIPRPRLKPIEIMMVAAANMKIEPASAEPQETITNLKNPVSSQKAEQPSGIEQLIASDELFQKTAAEGKSDMATSGVPDVATQVPAIRPVLAASVVEDINWWPDLISSSNAMVSKSQPLVAPGFEAQNTASGKSDLQVVNRAGKGDIETSLSIN